jgi:hypothetical protein
MADSSSLRQRLTAAAYDDDGSGLQRRQTMAAVYNDSSGGLQ